MPPSPIAQLVSEAVVYEGLIDIYAVAGIDKPELSSLSDEFLYGLAKAERPNLLLGLLRRLLSDEIHTRRRTNLVQPRRFAELLDEPINRHEPSVVDRRDHRRPSRPCEGAARVGYE